MRFQTTSRKALVKMLLSAAFFTGIAFSLPTLAAQAVDTPHSSMPPIQAKADTAPSEQGTWACPMHPEIHSDAPGRCPKCKMALVHEADEDN